MKLISKALVGGIVGAGILAFSAVSASASIVCIGNVCWHVTDKYDYPPEAGIVIHEDTWSAGPSVTFREHEGRGYWKGDVWTNW